MKKTRSEKKNGHGSDKKRTIDHGRFNRPLGGKHGHGRATVHTVAIILRKTAAETSLSAGYIYRPIYTRQKKYDHKKFTIKLAGFDATDLRQFYIEILVSYHYCAYIAPTNYKHTKMKPFSEKITDFN